MIYNYSQLALQAPGKQEWERRIDQWSTYNDPAISGVMLAAAIAYRQGHISPARTNYCLMLNREQLFDQELNAINSATIRMLLEQSRLTIGFPAIKELDWLAPTETPASTTILTDPNHDFIPAGQSFVRSDTGELVRNWKYGIQTINTPKTQSVNGWIGGKILKLGDTMFQFETRKAVVALTSLDDEPLSSSKSILITAMARAFPTGTQSLPFLSEPVVGALSLRTKVSGLKLLALGKTGVVQERVEPQNGPDGLAIRLPTRRGTHWYLLTSKVPPNG
jgi:hypothetical protein